MFEELKLIGPTERSIVLETRKGSRIKNTIEIEPGYKELAKYARMLDRHRADWEERKPATGVYNCIGHVWASRRTSVFEEVDKQVLTIFEDDGYRVIDLETESICRGDLVTYWESSANHRGFFHVGVVMYFQAGVSPQSPRIPWVLSKWDSVSGEVLHKFTAHPFLDDVPFMDKHKYACETEFWTDRPLPSGI